MSTSVTEETSPGGAVELLTTQCRQQIDNKLIFRALCFCHIYLAKNCFT